MNFNNNFENQKEILLNQEKDINNNNVIEELINKSDRMLNNNISINKEEEKLSEYIQVFCRFRPPNESELSVSTNNSVFLLSSKKLILTQEKKLELKKDYTFDGIFEYDYPKEKFYQKTSKKIINAVLQGFNGGIICYGETGTGKSYTIKEIIPQVANQIFDFIDNNNGNNELFKIDVSMIEIYKEQVNDLIDLKNTNLNLIENKSKKLIIDNLTHVGVSTKEQLLKIINKGVSNRNSREYNYNAKSHFITMITIYNYFKKENYIKVGKLYLVDLEGSERISKYNIEENNLEEQKLINKSLIALSIIVQNLSNENDNITYAPYRDSKLTRIISDCFGGNAYTSLILNCSKHECSSVQTRSTLMFGEKVKKIKNKPIINIENFSIFENGNDFEISFDKKNAENAGIIKQMKEKINYLNSQIEQLNQRNLILENEKKNYMGCMLNGGQNKLNDFYIKNNINDLHELLNEKENKEKELLNEINSLKIFNEKKNKEFEEMQQNQNENIKVCQDLTECLNEAGKQIKEKDEIINELKNKIEINDKDINDLKNMINKFNEEKENDKKNNDNKINELKENINNLNNKIKELNNELNIKEKNINELNKEKTAQLKNNENYEKKIMQLKEEINKAKEEIKSNPKIKKLQEEKNNLKNKLDLIEKEKGEQNNLINENNILKNQIKLLEKNYNNITTKNKELLAQINQRNKPYTELKDANEINNLRQENKKLNERLSSLEKHKKEENRLKTEIKFKEKTQEEFETEFHKIIQDNDEKIKEIKNLKKQLDNINRENNRNKNIIDNLRKEISDKNKIINDNKNRYNNNYSPIYNNNTNSNQSRIDNNYNKYMPDRRYKNELTTKENNEKDKEIERLKKEIQAKNKLIEENNKNKQCTCHNALIEKLRKEINSKNNIINDYKMKLDNLKNDLALKERTINDYKKNKYLRNYSPHNNNFLVFDTQIRGSNSYGKYSHNYNSSNSNNNSCYNYFRINQNNQNIQDQIKLNEKNIELLYQEINRYKEIIKQKEMEIIRIQKQFNNGYNYNSSNQNIAELQRIIKELRTENCLLKEQIIDYDNLKAEIEFIYKRGGNYTFKETNKTSLKLAYDALVEENNNLKQKINKLEKNIKK